MTDEPATPTEPAPAPADDSTPAPAVEPAPVTPEPVLPPADPMLMGDQFRSLPDEDLHHT